MIAVKIISRSTNSILRLLNTKCKGDVQKYEFLSSFFNLYQDFAPIVIPNFDNLNLELIKNNKFRDVNIDVDKVNYVNLEIEKIKNELSKFLENKLYLSKLYNETKKSVPETYEIRKNIKKLQNQLKVCRNELKSLLLAIPNISYHIRKENWINIPTRHIQTDNHKIIIQFDDLRDCFTKSFDEFSLQFIHGNLALSRFMIMEDAYDWWVNTGFTPIALSDISKTTIVECCQDDMFKDNIGLTSSRLTEKNDENNPYNIHFLKGSATLEAYCSYFMRTKTTSKSLPIKLLTLGNKYNNCDGSINQTTSVSILLGASTQDEMMVMLNELLETVKEFYINHFDLPISSDYLKYDQLEHWEGFRYVLNSNLCNKVPLATISVIEDYISRRLMILDTNGQYLHMVFANVLNFDSILNSIKENQQSLTYNFNSQWIVNNFHNNKC